MSVPEEAQSFPKPKRKTAPCPCGSGKQWRYCHGVEGPEDEPELAVRRNPRQLFLWLVLIGAPLAWAAGMLMPSSSGSGDGATVQVWSEEHGHYHTVSAEEAKAQKADAQKAAAPAPAPAAAGDGSAPAAPDAAPEAATTQPDGPAPPGKVWSEAHGHWHDVDGSKTGKELPQFDPSSGMPWDHDFKLERPDEEREGFTWSDAHGHWHPSAGQ